MPECGQHDSVVPNENNSFNNKECKDNMTDQQNKPDDNKLIAERRAKLHALREEGPVFPNDFRPEHSAAELQAGFGEETKEDLEKLGKVVRPQNPKTPEICKSTYIIL
jgi:lysyl-tRNA synthetase class II